MTGMTLGSYHIGEKLGEGAMGTVYRGVDRMLHREVAIKFLRKEIGSQPELLQRFQLEAQTLAKLNHPAVAGMYSFFEHDGQFFMVMEYVPGETLEQLIRREGALGWYRAGTLLLELLEGLGHAHGMGVLHRDIKPANVMVTPGGRPKLTDFGIAQVLGAARMTREGRLVGTLEYIAPERIQGQPGDGRSDLYSVGIVFFEMLTGRLPFEASSDYAILHAQLQEPPPRPSEIGIAVPAEIESVLARALAKDPAQRYPDAAAFAADLQRAGEAAVRATRVASTVPAGAAAAAAAAALAASPTTRLAQETPAPAAAGRPGMGLWIGLAAAGVLLLGAAGGGVWYLTRKPAPTPVVAVAPAPVAPVAEPVPAGAPLSVDPAPIEVPTPAEEPGPPPAAPQTAVRTPAPAAPVKRTVSAVPPPPTAAPVAAPAPEPVKTAPAEPVPAPAPAPAPAAPPRREIRSLADIRTIYVEKMPNQLDERLREEIAAQMAGRWQVASAAGTADAVMKIRVEGDGGNKVTGTAGRFLGLRGKQRAVVTVLSQGATLWQEEASDRQVILGAFKGDDAAKIARRLVGRLKKAVP